MIFKLENTISNIQKIAQLEKTCFFDDAWSLSSIEQQFSNTFSHFFAYNVNNDTVAYICVIQTADELQICNLAVHPSFRRQGIAEKLLNFLTEYSKCQKISQIVLEVNTQNTAALNLYQKCNFEVAGLRKNFYRQGRYSTRDALTLVKKIDC